MAGAFHCRVRWQQRTVRSRPWSTRRVNLLQNSVKEKTDFWVEHAKRALTAASSLECVPAAFFPPSKISGLSCSASARVLHIVDQFLQVCSHNSAIPVFFCVFCFRLPSSGQALNSYLLFSYCFSLAPNPHVLHFKLAYVRCFVALWCCLCMAIVGLKQVELSLLTTGFCNSRSCLVLLT